ncbi:MAG: hypothetical protein KFKLKKLM_01750 [Flavobacteriales bacterium]|nr:hypothetical protein [Flavobacteriales bacterium]
MGVFVLKILFGIFLTLIYTYYYTDRSTSDIYKYFDDSKIMFDALKTNLADFLKMLFGLDFDKEYFDKNYYTNMNFWYRKYESNMFSDSHIIIRFNAFVRLFSMGNIYVHNVFINFISLLGLTALFKFFKPFFIDKIRVLFYAIFLIPSVLFWGSGLLKESFILFGLGFLLLSLQQLFIHFKWYYLIIILLSFIILLYTKYYVLAALILPLSSYLIYNKIMRNKLIISYLFAFILLLSLAFIAWISKGVNPFDLIVSKHQEFFRFNTIYPSNSSFKMPFLIDWWSVIKHTPNAWVNTLIRPYLWESKSPFVLISALENLLFIGLLFLAILFPNRKNVNWFYVVFCLSFVMMLFSIIGLTIPIFGALVRYKVPGLPFLAIAFLFLIDTDLLKTKFTFLKKII